MGSSNLADLRLSPLDELHRELGARLVPFAGWSLPIQFPAGIIKEHLACRNEAALFDVSHMGQIAITANDAAERLERIVPGDIRNLATGRTRYTVLLNGDGGIEDDLMVTSTGDGLLLVVNAARDAHDLALLSSTVKGGLTIDRSKALLALQGPAAAEVMEKLNSDVAALSFMQSIETDLASFRVRVWRSGYTGEDGFEISVNAADAVELARLLLSFDRVAPAGLGARDTLRLEAGLPLYGHELDETTTPIEVGLGWVIGRERWQRLDFPGAERIDRQRRDGTARGLVGLMIEGRAPVRAGSAIMDAQGNEKGKVTSGGFSPSLGCPIAMGHVAMPEARDGSELAVDIRGRSVCAKVVAMPFVEHRYRRTAAGR